MTIDDRKRLMELANTMADNYHKQAYHLRCIMCGKPSRAEPWVVDSVNDELSRAGLAHLAVVHEKTP